MPRYVKVCLFSSLFACLAAIVIFRTLGTRARAGEHWVSVDVSELQHIMGERGPRDRTGTGSLRITQVAGDIAILRLNDLQMDELSRSMHDSFHKCGGFVAHESEQDAVAWIGTQQASRAGDLATVTYSIDNQAAVNPMLPEVSELENRQVIIDLSAFPNRRHDQPSGLQSANWIKNKWTALAAGRTDTTVEFYNHTNTPQPSIIMTIRGATRPDEIVILGGHQDSIRSGSTTGAAPGADDDASGIACLTETIRVLMAKGFKPERTVQFMAYAAEEVGLRGSNAIATAYRNANKNVVGVMQLDMTNYRGTQGYDMVMITDLTNAAQNQFVRDLISYYQPGLNVGNSTCGYGCSDHVPWNAKGYPVSFPFEAPIPGDNPTIHTANDTLAQSNNNANHAVRFTKLAVSYVGELAKGCLSWRSRCQSSFTMTMQ